MPPKFHRPDTKNKNYFPVSCIKLVIPKGRLFYEAKTKNFVLKLQRKRQPQGPVIVVNFFAYKRKKNTKSWAGSLKKKRKGYGFNPKKNRGGEDPFRLTAYFSCIPKKKTYKKTFSMGLGKREKRATPFHFAGAFPAARTLRKKTQKFYGNFLGVKGLFRGAGRGEEDGGEFMDPIIDCGNQYY